MATLEDKILGEKTHNYCSSSSESDGDDSGTEKDGAQALKAQDNQCSLSNVHEPSRWEGTSSNTGPKGVLRDWQRFKQLEAEKRKEQDIERLELMKKLSLTCRSALDEDKEKKTEENDPELAELLSDEFLMEYKKQRMSEMMFASSVLPKFGTLIDLKSGDDFLKEIDNENKSVTVIVHIYEENVQGCKAMNSCLAALSQDYIQVKFCKLVGSSAGMSHRFKIAGVPALLVYKGGQMVGNFVRLTDELGDEFYAGDVENYLIEHGMIVDRMCMPKLISKDSPERDSDVSLE